MKTDHRFDFDLEKGIISIVENNRGPDHRLKKVAEYEFHIDSNSSGLKHLWGKIPTETYRRMSAIFFAYANIKRNGFVWESHFTDNLTPIIEFPEKTQHY